MSKTRRFYLVFSLFLFFSLLVHPSASRAQGGPSEDHAGGPRQRIEVILRADGAPLPGGTTQLTLTATPLINAPDLEIQWILPAGVVLSGASTESFGTVDARQSVHSERTLSFPSPGTYKVAVSAIFHPADSFKFSASGVLFFIIDPDGSSVSDKDPDARRPARSGMGEQVTVTTIQPNIPHAPQDDPCFSVNGFIDRIDRPSTPSGYGANIRVPVVGALVEIREEDILFDDSYAEVRTDANGNFSASFCDDDGWFDDELEIYFRLFAERGSPKVYVEDSSWIDEEYEYDSSAVESEGGTINFNLNLDFIWSGMFNIVDAAFLARQLWVDNGDSYSEETEIHWEAAYGDEGSYFDPFWNEITIADDPSNPDQWDDSVIMHEWGHSADDYYSCDDNPGGDHFINQLVDDPELAWGEGYPDYYQSAVRAANGYQFASWYFDIDGSDVNGIMLNLEPYDTSVGSNLISTLNELAIAAALWDLNDNANDGQDTVSHGHNVVQDVYTSDAFYDIAYGFFDDTCDFDTYMRGWVDAGKPTDAATAASILQNTGYTLQASLMNAQSSSDHEMISNSFTPAEVYRWWKQLTYVGDNSASMNGSKFEAMKSLFAEAVNDFGDDSEGTEFSLELFNNTSTFNNVAFAGQFFPENLIGPINALNTIPDADPNCDVYALRALSQAVDNKEDGDVWLFTDGDTVQSPSVEAMRQVLNDKSLRASIALMGICPAVVEASGAVAPPPSEVELQALSPEAQQERMADHLLRGSARASLGLMADEVPGGLVPYLLTAINSGGQFLYVDASQVDDAADILRSQITNSAGAGRWSDYVSDSATYRYDRLASWEYGWIDATAGENQGNPLWNSYLDIPLPEPFTFYEGGPYDTLHVFQDGFVTFGNHLTYAPDNTTIPSLAEPNNAIYPLWDEMEPFYIIPNDLGVTSPNVEGWIFTMQSGEWFVLEYFQYMTYTDSPWPINTFEILLNQTTGEIRFQYLTVPDGAASATIGVEDNSGTSAVMVSYNDQAGAADDMGYKFTPAPPQPTRTYSITVDSTMESVGFLLAGYSGSFEPLLVTDPDGDPVDCAEAGSLCLNLDLVQYVQVNTNGRTGEWHAVVDAGPTGSGTFSFFSMAASPIAVDSPFDHILPSIAQGLNVQMTQPVDGDMLTGQFHLANGEPFGGDFSLFDDGLHGDGREGDGVFGSDPFSPPSPGSAYLSLMGGFSGVNFKRIDPLPYTFSPVEMTSLGDGANFGGVTQLQWEITNYDSVDHCYWYTYDAPPGWWIDFSFLPIVCVDAGQTYVLTTPVYMTAGTTNNLPSGTTGLLTLSISEWEKGEITDSASARITRHREPALISIHNPIYYLRPGGDEGTLDIYVVDAENVGVADGTPVYLSASTGVISPTMTTTEGGFFRATFTSGPTTGVATITVWTENNVTATTEVEIGNPKPSVVTLEASDYSLPPDGISTASLVATVRDRWGTLMPNQMVRIGVEQDGQMGTIQGTEVVTGTTNTNGQFTAVFTSGEVIGKVGVRAELVYDDGAGLEVISDDRKVILLGSMTFIPLINR